MTDFVGSDRDIGVLENALKKDTFLSNSLGSIHIEIRPSRCAIYDEPLSNNTEHTKEDLWNVLLHPTSTTHLTSNLAADSVLEELTMSKPATRVTKSESSSSLYKWLFDTAVDSNIQQSKTLDILLNVKQKDINPDQVDLILSHIKDRLESGV